ncbi:hypothetical protein [Rhodococcus sp. H29-C3]|uniref:hypothetical protein n=1 Tax=Rhodococcus sp. H29-C3 TaxID=3046307 RepID=UPI0024BB8944|nr:hypothetical protein [Rhodococcus sp. H29-C3]MDJ0363357.1 hypothetical protein [Rhodococcus sp. H29-C3]
MAGVVDEQVEFVALSTVPQSSVSGAGSAYGVAAGVGADEWTAEAALGAGCRVVAHGIEAWRAYRSDRQDDACGSQCAAPRT